MDIKILIIIILSVMLIYFVYNPINKSEKFDPALEEILVPVQKPTVFSANITDDEENINISLAHNNATYGDNYFLDDGAKGELGLSSNMCSKSCCSPQYPPPFNLPIDPMVCNSKQKFIPSSYTCNNGWQDTGCLCMTEDQANFLSKRGNNN